MMTPSIEEVDVFIGDYKTLVGLTPPWCDDGFHRYIQARWAIQDASEIERGEICLSCRTDGTRPSVLCMYKQNLIYRLDIAPENECKDNSFDAIESGLPHQVCGSHVHGWCENRSYIERNGFSRLPNRRPPFSAVTNLRDAMVLAAEDLGITITPQQRVFDLPPLELF